MRRIAAIQPAAAYAPELMALSEYLASTSDMRLSVYSSGTQAGNLGAYDALYMKMGFAPIWKRSPAPEIHDYSSASGGRSSPVKHLLKTHASRRPLMRTFLSHYVRGCFPFRDDIPYVIRDMGVPDTFIAAGKLRTVSAGDFDLFYAGSVTDSRNSADLLQAAERTKQRLLVVGRPQDSIYQAFKNSSYVTFAGAVAHAEIPDLAGRCRFAINLTPDVIPLNRQTSTKVLEYLALGLPVVTNDYSWIRGFEARSGARMLKFRSIKTLSRHKVLHYSYKIPDMSDYRWSRVFDRSGIYPELQRVIAGAVR